MISLLRTIIYRYNGELVLFTLDVMLAKDAYQTTALC